MLKDSHTDAAQLENVSPVVLNEITPLIWGDECKAWFLLDKEDMCVVHEEMPPQTTEQLHLHNKVEQFFFVISGTLSILMDDKIYLLAAKQGILVPKQIPHRVFNDSTSPVEFILFSTANPRQDRVNIAELGSDFE